MIGFQLCRFWNFVFINSSEWIGVLEEGWWGFSFVFSLSRMCSFVQPVCFDAPFLFSLMNYCILICWLYDQSMWIWSSKFGIWIIMQFILISLVVLIWNSYWPIHNLFFISTYTMSLFNWCFSWSLEKKIHFCPLPSADVRTQAMYQLLDSGFIGLIFSCFSEDAQKVCFECISFRNILVIDLSVQLDWGHLHMISGWKDPGYSFPVFGWEAEHCIKTYFSFPYEPKSNYRCWIIFWFLRKCIFEI